MQKIKLIRAIRLCKTPALGGHVITCKDCGHKHYVYHSCGHSQCMICQSIKREQWVDKLKNKLLRLPYVHTIFTLPHQLNGLVRANQSIFYSLIMKVAWKTIQQISSAWSATPGMTAILHTFGSDLKYHIHVHALVTYGGLNNNFEWVFPHQKNKLEKYRIICSVYKNIFIHEIEKLRDQNKLTYHIDLLQLLEEVRNIRWVVHTTHPTMHTEVIEKYLAKYINRIAISNNRLSYLQENNTVQLLYNDYQNQQSGFPAPKKYKYLDPLVAIDQILQHTLPAYFQKSRNYGLHHSTTKIAKAIPNIFKRTPLAIRTVFEIITHLLKLKPFQCIICQSNNYSIDQLPNDKTWILNYLPQIKIRMPPLQIQNISPIVSAVMVQQPGIAMPATANIP